FFVPGRPAIVIPRPHAISGDKNRGPLPTSHSPYTASQLPFTAKGATMTDDIELDAQADDQKLLAQVVEYYQRSLKSSPEALDYLRGRGITHGQAIEQFRIGYANRTLGLKLPGKHLKSGRELRARLEALNIFRAKTGHEHFNGCVVLPIFAADGTRQIVDIYGRKVLGRRLRKGTPLHMNMAEQRRG